MNTCPVSLIIQQCYELKNLLFEESDFFFIDHFTGPFAVLLNKINNFTYTYEAKLLIASLENLHAIAVVNYSKNGRNQTQDLISNRRIDGWNVKEFSGFNLSKISDPLFSDDITGRR